MKTLGIFEIKTKLSQIFDEVVRTGKTVLVTKRGKPYVKINPLYAPDERPKGSLVWDAREEYSRYSATRRAIFLPLKMLSLATRSIPVSTPLSRRGLLFNTALYRLLKKCIPSLKTSSCTRL